MSRYLSDKLRVISFALICMVVLLHSQILGYTETPTSLFVQRLVSGQITRIAVDFFFTISGFLFACSIDSKNIQFSLLNKIKKRFSTLLIPYVIWVGIGVLMSILISSVYPDLSKIHSWSDIGLEFITPKVVYQMWFVRDLFIVCLMSPLLYWIIKKTGILFVTCLLIWYGFFWTSMFVSLSAIVFFSLGMFISINHKTWVEYRFRGVGWISLFIIWFIFCVFLTYYQPHGVYYLVISVLLGMVAIWSGYDILSETTREKFTSSSIIVYSFFIFLFHEPMLTIVKKGYISTIGVDNDITSLALYFFAPVFVIAVCIVVGRIFKTHMPMIYKILTGDR